MTSFPPVPVTILTGFLGAGKTTLLNRLLKDPAVVDTAVIVNEFGEVAVDHMLVEAASDGIVALSDGCLCCTVRGELVDTLADLAQRMADGRLKPLARIVVETTGLADPVPVMLSVMAHPSLVDAYRLDGIVTVVDAVNAAATLDGHVEAVRQVAVADRIVLTKADLAPAAEISALIGRIGSLNPGAPLLEAAAGEASPARLFDCGLYDPATKSADVARWLRDAAHHDAHHHHGHEGHAHDHRHGPHDERVKSFSLVHPHPLPLSAVRNFLDLLRSVHGEGLLRMKGVIETLEDAERPLVIHGVQKLLHPPVRLPAWPEGPRGARLVLIVADIPEDYVRRLFGAFVGRPDIDAPDRAALESNPLAIAGFRP